MTKEITYKGIDWEVRWEWDEARRDIIYMTGVMVAGTDADIYDLLEVSTLEGLYEALEASFE